MRYIFSFFLLLGYYFFVIGFYFINDYSSSIYDSGVAMILFFIYYFLGKVVFYNCRLIVVDKKISCVEHYFLPYLSVVLPLVYLYGATQIFLNAISVFILSIVPAMLFFDGAGKIRESVGSRWSDSEEKNLFVRSDVKEFSDLWLLFLVYLFFIGVAFF